MSSPSSRRNKGKRKKPLELNRKGALKLKYGSLTDNEEGITLNGTRWYFENEYGDSLNKEALEELVKIFNQWSKKRDFMILRKETRKYDHKCMDFEKEEYYLGECSKRGNGLYRWKLKKRFSWIKKVADKVRFFNKKDRSKNHKTKALFVSLTYDTKRCSRKEAWLKIGKEYNRFTSGIRRKFGKCSVFRCFESTKKGYPQPHLLIIFEDKEFDCFPKKNKKGKIVWRIFEKKKFEKYYHSFVDVEAIYDLAGALNYIKKYQLKVHKADLKKYKKKGKKIPKISKKVCDLTLSLCWLFRKRSFAISGNLRKNVFDLIDTLSNSNKRSELIPLTLTGKPTKQIIWHFEGIFSLEHLKKPPPKPIFGWIKIKKPKPNRAKKPDTPQSRLRKALDKKKALDYSYAKKHFSEKLIQALLKKGLLIRSGSKVFPN